MTVPKIWGREPVLVLGFAAAAINLAVGFGLPLSTEQVALLNAFVVSAVAFVARSRVTPV